MKRVMDVLNPPPRHWVGDGFPVRSLFGYDRQPERFSPFLLLDRAGPLRFEPASQPRGVGSHPHRGFETVSIVFEGEVAHRDSTGQGGVIGPGDVQWMTAGAGILHQEFHSESFTRSGGNLDMVQLWVNLPARHKLTAPGYQAITRAHIPVVSLPHEAGELRLIAGSYSGQQGPARTFSPMHVWDLRLRAGAQVELPAPRGWHAIVVALHGQLQVNGTSIAGEAQLALLDDREGEGLVLHAASDATALLLAGEPLDEPVVGYGPFVMNSRAEIMEAVHDFQSGRFGDMAAT